MAGANSLRGGQLEYHNSGVLCGNYVEDRKNEEVLRMQKSYVGQQYHSVFKPGVNVSRLPAKFNESNILKSGGYDPQETFKTMSMSHFNNPDDQVSSFKPRSTKLAEDPAALEDYTRRWTKSTGKFTHDRISRTTYREFAEIKHDTSDFLCNQFRPGHEGLWH
eukprot:Rmarinus@m.28066